MDNQEEQRICSVSSEFLYECRICGLGKPFGTTNFIGMLYFGMFHKVAYVKFQSFKVSSGIHSDIMVTILPTLIPTSTRFWWRSQHHGKFNSLHVEIKHIFSLVLAIFFHEYCRPI